MRALRALMFLLPMLASAGWRQVATLPGTPQDVLIADAGVVLAVSSGATGSATAWQVSDAGVNLVGALTGPNGFIGAGLFGSGCLVALDSSRNLNATAGCGLPTAATIAANTAVRFRLLADPPLVVAVTNTGSFDSMYSGSGTASAWSVVVQGSPWLGVGQRSLQHARVGGVDYAVMNVNGATARLSIDGGASTAIPVPAALKDAAPFPRLGAPALLGSAGGVLTLVPDLRAPTLFTPSMPTGLIAQYVGIGGAIGMVTTSTGEVLSPIPDPARPTEIWRVRSGAPSLTYRINCLDDRWCASLTTAGAVWFWENEVAPLVAVSVPPFDAGQTIRLVADAGDGDGDPVYVSWSADAGTFAAVAGVEDGTAVDFTVPSGSCNLTAIDVSVTDGLSGHERSIQVPLSIIDRGALQTVATTLTPLAGGPAVGLTASIVGGCATPVLSWSTSEGQTGAGAQFAWSPPVTECTAGGRQVTVTTTATWPSGVPSVTSSSQILTIVPWGAPPAPVFPSPATQPSGSTADWLSSGTEHACSASSGFPGTELLWTVDAGGALAQAIDGGLRVTAPSTCVPLRVSASALRQVQGEDAGRLSVPGPLVVDILPDTAPLDATTPFSMSVQGDGGWLFGDLDAGASCLAQRLLQSDVIVSSAGSPISSGQFMTPGGWQLAVPGGCSGGTYDVTARLFEDGGFTGATAQGSFTLSPAPARVGTLSVDRVDVRCGSGARVSLTLAPVPDACGTAELSWRAVGGPALVTAAGTGDVLALQTEALDFSTVGQQVALEWVADAGIGNRQVATRTIELSVQPFLEVSVRTSPPLRREEEPDLLDVTLRNTTECAVEGLSVTLPLSGGSPVLESVRVDGLRAEAQLTEQGLVIEGVSVPASGVASIQLSARARLLSSPTLAPVAFLRGYPVSSIPSSAAAPTGCGCASLASPLLGLVLLVVLRRRRQPPR